ncbi:hypothetical protein Ahy_B02g057568 isoform D [Arachis hypogaea]|uniref:Uncharacterized protein n=1 Tax=Arachis hypogaea TaxID=3818 RepID=A0A445AC93_ARAHY|nr:hypothetical protein Ahy_B02g057568 isoform D [Arachis hypogaea]
MFQKICGPEFSCTVLLIDMRCSCLMFTSLLWLTCCFVNMVVNPFSSKNYFSPRINCVPFVPVSI